MDVSDGMLSKTSQTVESEEVDLKQSEKGVEAAGGRIMPWEGSTTDIETKEFAEDSKLVGSIYGEKVYINFESEALHWPIIFTDGKEETTMLYVKQSFEVGPEQVKHLSWQTPQSSSLNWICPTAQSIAQVLETVKCLLPMQEVQALAELQEVQDAGHNMQSGGEPA